MNQQIKAGLSAMKDFLAGRSNDEKAVAPEDKATREVVAAELLAAMSGRSTEPAPENPENAGSATQEIPRFDSGGQAIQDAVAEPADSLTEQEQERARQLFLEHGYFDEAVHVLRAASAPAERAAAARALGVVGSRRATAHLIAAMFDDDAEVRDAAAESLIKIGEPVGENVSALTRAEVKQSADASSTASPINKEDSPPDQADTQPIETAARVESVRPVVAVSSSPAMESNENDAQRSVVAQQSAPDLVATNSSASEVDQFLLEEQNIQDQVASVDQQAHVAVTAFKEMESEVRWRTERETQLRAEAMARRLEEEEARRRVEEETEIRRAQEREAVEIERAARLKAETEVQRYADEEASLRMKARSLRLEAAEVARRRADQERAREEAAEATLHAESTRVRDEARSRHEAELGLLASEKENLETATNEVLQQRAEAERLRQEAQRANSEAQEQLRRELENLRQLGEEINKRRAEVEAAREKADEDAARLIEAQARMQSAEAARAQAELERSQLETEINQQVDAQLKLLEETRRQGEEKQTRLQEELRLGAEKEQQRLGELEMIKGRAELESKKLAEREQEILGEVDSLRIADSDTRRRIEDAEVKRRAAVDAYHLIAEKVQRVEAEAHARAQEEERILAKLEAERRNAATDAQSRAEQEKRVREEIEMFRRLEEEERPRIEEATLQLAAAESRLQERKDRLKEDAEARLLAEEELITVGESGADNAERSGVSEWQDRTTERPSYVLDEETTRPVTRFWPASSDAGATAEVVNDVDYSKRAEEISASVVTPAITTYLNSVDPYKRAAAVAELARSGSPDAFSRIAVCFDDHSTHVRNAAARALRKLEPDRTVDLFNRALEEASPERRRNIGAAIAASGLATEAINNLASESREDTYNALSILFVMAKTGEVEPLVRALDEHGEDEIGKAVSKLLTLSGHR